MIIQLLFLVFVREGGEYHCLVAVLLLISLLMATVGERATCGNVLSLMISTAVAFSDTVLVCLHCASGGVFSDGFFELDDLVLLRAVSAETAMRVSKQFRILSCFLGG